MLTSQFWGPVEWVEVRYESLQFKSMDSADALWLLLVLVLPSLMVTRSASSTGVLQE